jgi:hypothetical protein
MQPTASKLETPLPRAIRRQMERVSARQAEIAEQRSAAGAPPPPNPANGDPAAPTPGADPALDANAAPVPPAPPAQTPPSPDATGRENDPVYWRNRFSVMQGINEKLRQDHAEALLERDRRHGELTDRVHELEQQLAARPSGGEKKKLDLTLFFTQDTIDKFGEDQCETMAQAAIAAARTEVEAVVADRLKPIENAAKDDKARKAKEADDAFWAKLDGLVPDWQEINAEKAWLDWLKVTDDEGEVRQARMNRHRNALNAQGVAKLFRDYLKTKPQPRTPPVAPSGGAGGGGGGETPPANTAGKGYPSAQEIKDFSKRAATIRNPRDPRFVTDKERAEFDARLRLPKP